MKTNASIAVLIIAAAAALTGCANPGYPSATSSQYPSTPQSNYAYYGVIDSIQMTQASGGAGVGVGTVVGGVVGGLLGNQVGGGSGRDAATVAGVVGGAVVGNQIDKNRQTRNVYQIGVRLDNGSYQTITQENIGDLRVGNRVSIQNNQVYRY